LRSKFSHNKIMQLSYLNFLLQYVIMMHKFQKANIKFNELTKFANVFALIQNKQCFILMNTNFKLFIFSSLLIHKFILFVKWIASGYFIEIDETIQKENNLKIVNYFDFKKKNKIIRK